MKAMTFLVFWVIAGVVSMEAGVGQRIRALDDCKTQKGYVRIGVSVSRYPHVWRHVVDARAGRNTASDGVTVVSNGLRWPRVLVKNDHGEDRRRAAAFAASGVKTRHGFDRDEYPAAVLRSTALADIRYVPSSENRSQGANMGNQLRPWCNGQRVRLVRAP